MTRYPRPGFPLRRLDGLLAVAGLVALTCSAGITLSACQHQRSGGDRADKGAGAKTAAADRGSDDGDQGDISVTTTPDGRTVLHLSDDAIRRADLEITSLTPAAGGPQTVAYGRFIADPARTFMLRAPVAGTIVGLGKGWPELGSRIGSGAALAGLAPVLAPADQVSLSAQLAAARGQVLADRARLVQAQADYLRAHKLNSEEKNVSDSALQQARATRYADAARLHAGLMQVKLLGASLSGRSGGGAVQVLKSPASGEITRLLVSLGEAVPAGAALMQISDFSSLVAQVEIPLGEAVPALSASARIVPASAPGIVLPGQALGLGTDANWQGEVRLYRVKTAKAALRPGMAIAAYLSVPTASGSGVVIPRSAIVYTQGEAWAYVEPKDGQFVRQEVATDQPAPGGYYVAGSWKTGDRVVTDGEQALLSQEQQSGLSGGGGDKGKKKGDDDDLDG